MNIVLEARELSKIYTEGSIAVPAVDRVNLEAREGEIIGLFGPSGSGKTTLLSMLGCILRATSGSLSIFDHEVSTLFEADLPAIRKRYVSFIFQGFNLFPALTASENVMLMLKLKGVTGEEADERTRDLFTQVGLSARMNFLPRDMSGGQRQRVAIARALASDAPLILADEPTGNLDHSNGENVMALLKKLAVERNRCVIVATHDNRVEQFFDRRVTMEDGKIAEIHYRRSS